MSEIPLSYLPGVCKVNSAYASSIQAAYNNGKQAVGRFTDADGVRFVAGVPEGLGNLLGVGISLDGSFGATGNTTFNAYAIKSWTDFSGNTYTAIAHNNGVAIERNQNGSYVDITPLRGFVTGTLTNPLTTSAGSATVSVAHTAHGLNTGDWVYLSASAVIDTITVKGYYTNITKTDANNYTFVAGSKGVAGVGSGGGTVTYNYPRVVLTNPFSTTITSSTVKVSHTAHGAKQFDIATFTGGSAIGGLTISGPYEITDIIDANTYNIQANSNATSTVNSAGGSPSVTYGISGNSAYTNIQGGKFQTNWFLDTYGQQLLIAPYGDTIYIFDPVLYNAGALPSYPLLNAPTNIYAMFVTPERFVFALGTAANALLVQWADQTDYTIWTAAANNTANSRTLKIGSKCVAGIAVRDGISIVWTDAGPVIFSYTGDTFVYTSTTAGVNCGLIGPHAMCVMGQVAYWYSGSEFWNWNGSTQPLPSDDIRDYISANLYRASNNSPFYFVLGSHTNKKEIWGFYSSILDGTSQLPTRNIIYHTDQQCWSIGTMSRSAWEDSSVYKCPITIVTNFIGTSTPTILYHDILSTNNGAYTTVYAPDTTNVNLTLSPMDVAKGEMQMDVFAMIPDFERLVGSINFSVLTQDYPQSGTGTNGPYAVSGTSGRIDLRSGAKLIGWSFSNGGNFRLGVPRIEAQPAGARR